MQPATAYIVIMRCKEFKYCTNSPNFTPPTTTISIKWLSLTNFSLKLNIDGAFKGKHKKGDIGGIFRNSHGNWILGYYNSTIAYTLLIWSS